MKRREWVRKTGIAGTGLLFSKYLGATDLSWYLPEREFVKTDFGPDFKWGVASSSYQTEGAWHWVLSHGSPFTTGICHRYWRHREGGQIARSLTDSPNMLKWLRRNQEYNCN